MPNSKHPRWRHCASLSLSSFVAMKGNRHFYSVLSWLILDISFRARWIMPWMCQFPRGAKARLDNQFVCSDESHVAEADRFVLWSGWMWAACASKPYIIPWRALCLSGSLEVRWKTAAASRYHQFWQLPWSANEAGWLPWRNKSP